MTDHREPMPLQEALAALGRDLGLPDTDVVDRVTDAWNELAGAPLVAHARVRSVHAGVCTIAVDAPAWATPARYLEQGLVTRVADALGPGVVTAVRIVVPPAGDAS